VNGLHKNKTYISGREPFRILQPGACWPIGGHQPSYHIGSPGVPPPPPPQKLNDCAYIGTPSHRVPQTCSGQANSFAWAAPNPATCAQGLPPSIPNNVPKVCPPQVLGIQESQQQRSSAGPPPFSDGHDHEVPAQHSAPLQPAQSEAFDEFPKGITPETQHAFRASHGLGHPSAVEFMGQSEFVCLGAYCAVSRALQVLGLRRRAYPFDSVRSPIEGVIHCLNSEFEDFLTFTETKQEGAFKVFTGSHWGGSFWHHNPATPESKEIFLRRVLRLYGQGDVPDTKPRVFIRAVNSTKELNSAVRLRDAVQRALPKATCYLLLMVDMQATAGPIRLTGPEGRNILFYKIHESLFQQHTSGEQMMQLCSEKYAEALAFAIKYWAQCLDPSTMIGACCSLEQLSTALQHFSAGEPANQLFWPNMFMGQQLSWRASLRIPKLLGDNLVAHVRVPEGIAPGDVFYADVFGKTVPVKIPSDMCCKGELVKLTMAAGVVSATLTTMGVTTAAAAAAAVATSAVTRVPSTDVTASSSSLSHEVVAG